MIPLSEPHISGNEWKYVKDCLDNGWVSTAGEFVTKFEEAISSHISCKYAVACNSGTSGLHIALETLEIGKGDQVIVPNITFVATANAVQYSGASPIFMDIDPDSWQIDLDLLEEFLASTVDLDSIKAVIPVHVLGNICDMERLRRLADQYNFYIIDDASEALGSRYKDNFAGALGDINVFSFNGNKIITTGGGGMITTDNLAFAKRAKHLTTQAKVKGQDYYHDEVGYNYRMVNILAAVGLAQFEKLDEYITKKREIDKFYRNEFEAIDEIKYQQVNNVVYSNSWLFTFYSNRTQEIKNKCAENEIMVRQLWTPMNELPMYLDSTYISKQNYSKDIHQNCISIPSSVGLSTEDMITVANTIKSCFQ